MINHPFASSSALLAAWMMGLGLGLSRDPISLGKGYLIALFGHYRCCAIFFL
jgi:hypothetical protein